MSTLQLGSHGDDVAAWQRIIGVPADGDFGPKTLAATKRWQRDHGLLDDGIVGPKTWAKAGGAPSGGGGGSPEPSEPPSTQAPEGGLVFPLFHPMQASYRTGGRYFGAARSGGRLHAAVDLIAPHLWPIRAIADGEVIQAPYYFYTGTNALEVRHPGVGTVRYGEIDMNKVVRLAGGSPVRCGQVIAYVGRLDSGSSMLHFELYSGRASGALTVRGNPPYQRRRDLQNPTSLVDRLYQLTFN